MHPVGPAALQLWLGVPQLPSATWPIKVLFAYNRKDARLRTALLSISGLSKIEYGGREAGRFILPT